jgi:hypothetical protein
VVSAGGFLSFGVGAGLDNSLSLEAGVYRGGTETLSGRSVALGVGVGRVGGSAVVNTSGELIGGTLGIGGSIPAAGSLSIQHVTTGVYENYNSNRDTPAPATSGGAAASPPSSSRCGK